MTQEQEDKLKQEMEEMMARLEPIETPSEEEIKRIWNTRNNLTFNQN
jgi:predicted  nucleic acid-binding Zn-ribbon protein